MMQALRLSVAVAVACAGTGWLPAASAAAPSSHDKSAAAKTSRKAAPAPAVRHDSDPDIVLYGRRADVLAFAQEAASQTGLDAAWLADQLAQARYQPSVARLIMPAPAGASKNWEAYRARFLDHPRLRDGLRWWHQQADWLHKAESRWGVPAALIVAIVGVETHYGRVTGNYKVIDALATLSFDFPSGRSDRSAFFRSELLAFLRWCAAEGRDPQQVKGSYAGAIGLPQFMPSSILKYAVDFDGDGHIDLQQQGADVVGSVAHYFAQFGWKPGLPTHYSVAVPSEVSRKAALLLPDIVPSFSPQQMADLGAVLDDAGRQHPGLLALVELQNGQRAPSYVAGTENFYVVTRYNWSSYYAMAVIELARTLRQMRPEEPALPASGVTTEQGRPLQ